MKKILFALALCAISIAAIAKPKQMDITFYDMYNNTPQYTVHLYGNGPIRCTPSSGLISPDTPFVTQCVDTVPDDSDSIGVRLDKDRMLTVNVKDLNGDKPNYCFIYSSNEVKGIRCTTELSNVFMR